ncbi:MAG: YihY/virulence factor BrkB family protein [bacterium]
MKTLRFIGRVIHSFFLDDCLNYAANISFCALLAIIPIAMIMVSIAGYFLGSSQGALDRIIQLATDVLPVGREAFVANLQSVLDQRASLGIAGIVFLLFIATILVAAIERALDAIFRTPSRRNFFHSRLVGIALIVGATVLFSLPAMAQILEGLLQRYGFGFPLSDFMSGKAYLFLVAFLTYVMTIVVIPNRRIYIRYAAIGGIIFSVGIVVAKLIFRAYMIFALQRYNIIYGSLTAVVLLVVWIYYLSVVVLLSAEFVAAMQEARFLHRRKAGNDEDWDGMTV